MIVSSWNVRGLNKSSRQLEVGKFLKDNKVVLAGIIETRVKLPKAEKIRSLGYSWTFSDNYTMAENGRIWVG